MAPQVLYNHRENNFEIILNRPEKRNAIDWSILLGIGEAIEQAERAEGVRTVLLRGEGPSFSSGIDLTTFKELGKYFGDNWQTRMLNISAAFQNVLLKVERCTLPTIALLHGHVLGLGFELALACDFRLAAQGTKIGLPEARIGLIPDVGGTTRLARLIGPARAKELVLTGRTIDAELAEEWGAVNAVIPPADLIAQGQKMAAELALSAPMAVHYAKRIINESSNPEYGLHLEAWAQNHLIQSEDFQIGVQAMITKSMPEWKGK